MKAVREKWEVNYMGKTIQMNLNDSEIIMRNHKGLKEMAQCFSTFERKELSTESYTQLKYPSWMKEKSRHFQMKDY